MIRGNRDDYDPGKTATIWMISLLSFATGAITSEPFFDFRRNSLALELFLRFGADSDIVA